MNLKKLSLIIVILYITNPIFAQVTEREKDLRTHKADTIEGWKKGGVFTVAFSQVSLSNWASGGENSFSGNTLINAFANYKRKRVSVDNSLDFGYGIMKQGKDGLRKTDDKLDFTSKYGRKLNKTDYIAALFNFKTQAMPGYNYPNDSAIISKFMAPGYLLFAAGYDLKRKNFLSLFFAPVTGKITFVCDQNLANAGAFGVEPAIYDENSPAVILQKGRKSRIEFGGYFKGSFTKDIMKNVKMATKLELFSNYINKPQNIDIYWENTFSMKINKYITATLSTTLAYDDDVMIDIKNNEGNSIGKGPRTQFKEVFGLGFSYKF